MSHENVMSSMLAYTNVATIYESDVYMAYLPLAHVLELIAGYFCSLHCSSLFTGDKFSLQFLFSCLN